MKKLIACLLVLAGALGLIGCVATTNYNIRIVIPAGSQEEFVYSDEEIAPLSDQFTIKSIDVADGTRIELKAVGVEQENVSTYLDKGQALLIDTEKGAWFKIGVAIQNPTDEDIVVVINVENVNVRIE